jgi:phosphate transport system substrate-binding protein
MAYRYGRCGNFDYCSVADGRKDVAAPQQDFHCPECRKPLTAPRAVRRGNVALLSAVAVVLAVVAAGEAYLYLRGEAHGPMTAARMPETAPAAIPAVVPPPVQMARVAPPVVPEPLPPPIAGDIVLRLSGSNTIGAVLGPKLAQRFLIDSGDANVSIMPTSTADEVRVVGTRGDKTEIIAVAAHGSATAFTGLATAAADIGMASRRIKPSEAATLAGLGDMTSPGNEHVLALDGIAVVVNPANPVASLTLDQLRGIFSGAITNWSQIGEAPGDIHVYARDDKSGTFDTFKALVLGSTKLTPAAKRIEDSRELSADVTQDRGGIGFIGLPYILAARAVPVGETGASPLLPNRLTVGTEDYALSRRLFLYTTSHAANGLSRRFVDFALSQAGQDVVEETGFVPLTITPASAPVPQTASAQYRSLVTRAARLSTNFRFQPNSAALDNRGQRDLDRLVNFVVSRHASPAQIILVGFADNQGSATVNLAVSRKRAQAVAAALAQRGLKVNHVAAFGSELPVADNVTDAGREKNRRVEVYMQL